MDEGREGKGMGVWVSEGRRMVKWMRAIGCVVWMRRREKRVRGEWMNGLGKRRREKGEKKRNCFVVIFCC